MGWALLFLTLLLLPTLWMRGFQEDGSIVEIPYSAFKRLVEQGEVAEVNLRGEEAEGLLGRPLPIGPAEKEAERFRTRVPASGKR